MNYILHGRYAHAPYRAAFPFKRKKPLTFLQKMLLYEIGEARGWRYSAKTRRER